MACPSCQHVAGMPFMAGTTLEHGSIRVALRCANCGHEWRYDMPITTERKRDSGIHQSSKEDEAFDRR